MWPGLAGALMPAAAMAQSIWDAGLLDGAARTEYRPGFGTAAMPVELRYDQAGAEGCLWNAADSFTGCPGRAGLAPRPNGQPVWNGTLQWREACGGDPQRNEDTWRGCETYLDSPRFSLGDVATRYWVLHANDDPSFDQCNEGPPGLSHPILAADDPRPGPLRFDRLEPSPVTASRHLRVGIDLARKEFFCAALGAWRSSLPFLSAGVQKGRGNPGPVGRLAATGSPRGTIAFTARVSSGVPFGCRPGTFAACSAARTGGHAGLYAVATWGGVRRLLFVPLYASGVMEFGNGPPAASKWNWPIAQSMFFPGAQVLGFAAGAQLETHCGIALPRLDPDAATATAYRLDAGRIFACADRLGLLGTPFPKDGVDLDGIHWYIEAAGTNGSLALEFGDVETALFVDGFD